MKDSARVRMKQSPIRSTLAATKEEIASAVSYTHANASSLAMTG